VADRKALDVNMPVDSHGNPIPVVGIRYSESVELTGLGSAPSAATQINPGGANRVMVLIAFGNDVYYVTGDASVAAPSANNGACVPAGYVLEREIPQGHTHIRAVTRTATAGALRIEYAR
jgi:hypothetical protein